MGKIIKIEGDIITIGIEGTLQEVRLEDLNFVPALGDEVEIYRTESRTLVVKCEPKKDTQASQLPAGGININMTQSAPIPQMLYQAGEVVNKAVYCLLAFFLGALGVQKFYAGKTGTGVLFLIFCWTGIPALIGLIECIIALFKPADANGNIVV